MNRKNNRLTVVQVLIFAFILLLIRSGVNAAFDYPHVGINSIACESCHFVYGTEPSLMPPWTNHEPQNIDDTQFNTLCWSCHNDIDAPYVKTHSSLQIDNSYGNWTVECRVCHNPHFQLQLRTYGSESYLYSGTSTNVTSTTITKEGAGWTDDEYEGLIVVPNVSQKTYNYKISSNTADTLTVEGPIDLTKVSAGNTFAIVYGKLIYNTIDLSRITIDPSKSGSKTVRFFNSEGTNSFADGNSTYDGICEVCHTQTTHFRNDGYGSDPLHENVGSPAGTKCTACHTHEKGFMHGGNGTGCDECHGHDPGYEGVTGGKGTYVAHSTHTENDSDDLRGPHVGCGTCHDTGSFPDFADGVSYNEYKAGTAMTTVCNPCHSPDGTYNGVNDSVVGAKNNWSISTSSDSRIYEADGSLKAGKGKWCATCHDESPSQIQSIYAPNVVGDEDGPYIYGTGWGFYKTGHGLSSSSTYPASGGVTTGAGKGCVDCHDSKTVHIDGESRTFDCDNSTGGACSSSYRDGYRLKDISSELPMEIPPTGRNAASYRLCFSCHTNTEDWLSSDLSYQQKTNFYDYGRSSEENLHIYHLRWSQSSELDWDVGFDGGMSCITCHNVHGSRNPVMIRSGELTGKASLSVRYGNDCSTHTAGYVEPVPNDITLEVSNKSTMLGVLASPYCTHCHGTGTGVVSVARTPVGVPDIAPELNWVGGPAYESDGVNPDAAVSGTEFTFKVEYLDVNQDGPPATIQLWIDRNNDGSYDDNVDPDLDEKIDMESAFVEPDTCAPYSKGVDYVTYVTLNKNLLVSGNSITYKFYAYYGLVFATGPPTNESTLTILNDQPELEWTGESGYEDDGVDPDYGPKDGSYAFRVKYIDNDGDPCPTSGSSNIQVWIDLDNSSSYNEAEMFNLTEIAAEDTDCTTTGDGKLYSVDRVLPNSIGGDVIYDYRFYANDGTDDATGAPVSSGGTVTVAGTTNNPPFLTWEPGTCRPLGAYPPRSATISTINFLVRYYDEDNQCPTGGAAGDIQLYIDLDNDGSYENNDGDPANDEIVNMDPYDGDAECDIAGGGKLYKLDDLVPTTVAEGITYEIHATDGTAEALGDPRTAGGTVDVIDAQQVVKQDGTGTHTIISAAISAGGLTTLVYDGTYNEYLSWPQWSWRYFYSACGAEQTIISNTNDPVVFFNHSGASVIDGFTVTGSSGRGIFSDGTNFDGTQSRPIINDCIIRNNTGRGIEGAESNVTITGCEIHNNGGGVLSYSTAITDTIIRNNTVTGNGGGIASRNPGGAFSLTNVVIKDNTASGNGGGIYCYNSGNSSYAPSYEKVALSGNQSTGGKGGGGYFTSCSPTFTNSLVSGNSAPDGGGIALSTASTAKFKNSTIVYNTASPGDGGAYYTSGLGNTVHLANSIAWFNRADDEGHIGRFAQSSGSVVNAYLYDSIIENNGDGNITDDNYFTSTIYVNVVDTGTNYDTDPNFVNPHANGDYHINEPSDAIDNAADSSGWGIPADDLEGISRPSGSEDIGAYERASWKTVTFTSSFQATAGESGMATITVHLSEASDQDVTVPFTVNGDSTATGGGTDYSISASPVTITAGETTAEITVTVAEDSLDENNETVIVDMGTPTNASRGAKTTHMIRIVDDDGAPTVSFASAGQATGIESGEATITVQLSGTSGRDVTVPFTVNGSSTAAGGGTDYSISASPVTITAGDTTAIITVTVATDSLDENNETVIVEMGTPTNATQGATTTHTVTITDDDALPSVAFTSSAQTTDDESGAAIITAQLSAVSGRNITVPFTVNESSTADDPDDYTITASPLTITAGNTSAVITVTVAADSEVEGDEAVIIAMGSPTNATLGATVSHTVTITDDDFIGNIPPAKPTNSTPTDTAIDVDRSPTLSASAFSDPDVGDTHAASQWQLGTTADFGTLIYDSGATASLTSHTAGVTLSTGTTYYWRVRYQDNNGAWSVYSTGTSFTVTTVDLPEGVVSYWKFDDSGDATANDSIGTNHGTLINNATWTASGKSGDAIVFDGTTDSVSFVDSPSISLTGDMTIEAWISSTFDYSGRTLISKGYSDEFDLTFYSGKLNYYSDRPSSPYYWQTTFNTVFTADGSWYHVVLVRDNAERTVQLYVNGVKDSVKGSYYSDPPDSGNTLNIGSRQAYENSFKGTIDEVVVYNRVLTEQEIAARFSAAGSSISFTPPAQPTNNTPVDTTTGVSITPTLTSSTFYDADGHAHVASLWQLRKNGGIYGDGDSVDTGITVSALTSVSLDTGTSWDAAGWSYRREISLAQPTVDQNHKVSVKLTQDNFDYSMARADGGDLRFYDANGTPLTYNLLTWNVSGESTVAINVATAGTSVVYIYYGKSDATDASDPALAAMTINDSGFEESIDFTGIWELKTGGVAPSWTTEIADEGANHHHVNISGDTNGYYGSIYAGQEFVVPTGISSASFDISYITNCSRTDRSGQVDIAIMTPAQWGALSSDVYSLVDEVNYEWKETIHAGTEADANSWTTESSSDNANLLTEMQGFEGQKMVAVAIWTGAHSANIEYGKLDNFMLTYTATTNPDITATVKHKQESPGSPLNAGTTYYWRVQHMDETGDWSLWSDETSFTTAP